MPDDQKPGPLSKERKRLLMVLENIMAECFNANSHGPSTGGDPIVMGQLLTTL